MRAIRIGTVVLGVTLTCAAAGAVAGALWLAAIGLVGKTIFPEMMYAFVHGSRGARLYAFEWAACIGAACGLLLGPLAVFGFLRRVPLGRLFVETTLAATSSMIVASALETGDGLWFTATALGFVVAVAHLGWRYRATSETAERVLVD
jgi:hypothetical protein